MAEHLTWDDLADLYAGRTGGSVRTRKMQDVFDWAEEQDDIETVDDGYLAFKEKK